MISAIWIYKKWSLSNYAYRLRHFIKRERSFYLLSLHLPSSRFSSYWWFCIQRFFFLIRIFILVTIYIYHVNVLFPTLLSMIILVTISRLFMIILVSIFLLWVSSPSKLTSRLRPTRTFCRKPKIDILKEIDIYLTTEVDFWKKIELSVKISPYIEL